MTLFVVDVEADGQYPGDFSMVSFGIVKVQEVMADAPTFYGKVRPISDKWSPEALAVSGHTREETLTFEAPDVVIPRAIEFVKQIKGDSPAIFVSDNNGFDWQFINFYFHKYGGENPFGFSSRRIGDFYAGLTKNFRGASQWKKHRQTVHDHNPVNDAKGNAEALVTMAALHGVKLPL